jgi:hypothetical protein
MGCNISNITLLKTRVFSALIWQYAVKNNEAYVAERDLPDDKHFKYTRINAGGHSNAVQISSFRWPKQRKISMSESLCTLNDLGVRGGVHENPRLRKPILNIRSSHNPVLCSTLWWVLQNPYWTKYQSTMIWISRNFTDRSVLQDYFWVRYIYAGLSGRSPAEIVGSNSTGGMEICLLWVLCVFR